MKSKKAMRARKPESFFRPVRLAILLLFFGAATGLAFADEEEGITIITGTPGPDIITVTITDVIDAQADIDTEVSEKVEASATGVDSLEGNDTITVNAPLTSGAAANALLLQTPEKKTEAIATGVGITAGDGDDSVDNNLAITVIGSSLSAYGSSLQFEQPSPTGDDTGQNDKKEIDASVSSTTETTGVVTGDGVDTIENDGLMTVNGLATSGGVAGDLTATIRESSTMKTTSASEVSATGIQAGGDSDTIINDGGFLTTATATSGALSVGLVAPGETTPPSDKKANIKTESNATAKATATGIHGDENETESNMGDSSPFGLNGLRVTYEKSMITVSGDDTIINNALQSGNATATSGAGAGSISNKVDGSVQTAANSESEATVNGINAGGGSDVIINSGELLSTATATSGALAVAVEVGAADANPPAPQPGSDPAKLPIPSKDKKSKSSTEASATAKATATGITADGDANSVTSTWALELIDSALRIDYRKVVAYLHGNDTVTNRFSINTFSLAKSLTDSVGVTVSSGGSAESKANAEAEAYSASIVTGAGDDKITNRGLLTTEAAAEATAVSVGLAVGQPPVDNGNNDNDPPTPVTPDKITSKSETNVTAKAHGYGIDADGLAENLTTEGSLNIGTGGLDFNLSRERELASGSDSVNNLFAITVDSSASADSTDASIQLDAVGSVNSEAKATAKALATGIATGAGDDTVVNGGLLTVAAGASADSISLGLTASKPPEGETNDQNGNTKPDKTNVKSDAGATATATAVGIDAEGKEHLHSTSGGLQISGSGLNFQLDRATESLAGSDTVTNNGIMTTSAVADSGAVSAGISINADGSVDSEASSRATAKADGILTGGGDDTVNNQALLTSNSTATATALAVSVSVAQPTDENGDKPSLWEKIKEKFASANSKANAEATSVATGIDTEGDAGRQVDDLNVDISSAGLVVDVNRQFTNAAGNDTVTNSGLLDATATARTFAGAADVKIETEGTASSETNATAKAKVGGVLTGGGIDTVANSGAITASADAEAGSISVSFTQPDGQGVKSKADSKAVAEAKATGIDSDDGRESGLLDTHLSIGPEGIDFSSHAEEIALAEADSVTNDGAVFVSTLTLAGAGGGAVSMDGAAKADVTAKSTSQSVAVDTGGGNDFIDNAGFLTSTAGAVSGALAVSFGQKSEEKGKIKVEVEAGATSEAAAVGIKGDSGADKLSDINLTINSDGLYANYLSQKTASQGNDIINNSGRIDSAATSVAGGLGVSIAIDGTAKADVNATSRSKATAVEGGGGDDTITSSGAVTAITNADAIALSVGVGKKTNENSKTKTKVEAKAETEATSIGIAADGGEGDALSSLLVEIDEKGLLVDYANQTTAVTGDDEIVNSGAVLSDATAVSGAVAVAVTIDGAASADVTSTAKSTAKALDAGGGNDFVDSSGGLIAAADASAGALSVGFGQKTDSTSKPKVEVKAAVTAESEAVGIAGDGSQNVATDFGLSITESGLTGSYSQTKEALSGHDEIVSADAVSASAFSRSGVIGASVAIDGAAKADIKATAKSSAAGIESGGGDDVVSNNGSVSALADSTAHAVAAGVGVKTSDGSKAKTKTEAETTAEATATGISTDGGDANSSTVISLDIDESGLVGTYDKSSTASSGNDSINNQGSVTSNATASSAGAAVAVTIKGGAQSKVDSTAKADSFSLNSGAGADDISNSGTLNSTSLATAATANVTVSTEGNAISNTGLLGAGTTANSSAIGISSAGSDYAKSTTVNTLIDFDDIGVAAGYESINDSMMADGADDILNSGNITTSSTALAPQVTVAVTSKGIAASIGRAKSNATASAIESGHDGDRIDNQGHLSSLANAEAYMANVAVTGKGLAVAGNSAWDGGTEAEAIATGINSDSGSVSTTSINAEVNADRAQIVYDTNTQWASGADQIANSGSIDTLAMAIAPGVSVAVTPKGVSAAVSTSKAKADSAAITAGDGDDEIDNEGTLTSFSVAEAVAANVAVTNKGVAAAADAVWDGGTTAEATATGIAGDGGDRSKTTRLAIGTDEMGYESTNVIASGTDKIHNTGNILTDATAGAASLSAAVAVKGVGIATSTSTAKAKATAIDSGAGEEVDDVYNAGDLSSAARAGAVAASVSVTNQGLALSADSVWDGGTKATAEARGIDLGAGGETITNDGNIDTLADAGAASASVAVTMTGVAGATATATGKADAVAIDASEGNDTDNVINNGDLTADARSGAAAASVSVVNKGLALASGAVWDGGTGAESTARGIDVGDGADVVENTGAVSASTLSGAAEAAVAVSVSGVAGATATSTSESSAVAIHAGNDDDNAVDTVTNSGNLSASADAGAVSAAVSFSNQGVAIAGGAVWDGGTRAVSDAKGIELGAGADTVDNSGDIKTKSISAVSELAASVSLTGVAGAIATSTGESSATAIDTGSGNAVDSVTNSGELSATSTAGAATAAVSVTNAGLAVAGGSVWDGGTKGISEARGIYMGAGNEATGDSVENSGKITATSIGAAAEVAAAISVSGVAGATATSTGSSLAAAIDASEGDDADTIINSGDLKADSTATAATTTVAFTNAGLAVAAGAVWDGGTTANSEGLGIAVGAGEDTVDNSGDITANSRAAAAELGVSVAVTGVAGAVATSTGNSSATAIDTGEEEEDEDTVINSGDLTVNSDALAATATVSVTTAGVAVAGGAAWEGGTKANSQARGIEVGEGADIVDNSGNIDIWSNSVAAEAAVAVAVSGVAGGIATATSDSVASGIDTGDGDYVDKVSNRGDIEATSHSLAATTSVSVTTAGVAVAAGDVWDGGTTAISSARGIEVGEGADEIANEGSVTSEAFAESASANVSVAVAGVAGAIATSSVDSESTALDAGAGEFDDTVTNSGDVSSLSSAITASAAVSFTAAGVAVAGDAVWEGGTSSAARSKGIKMGAGNDSVLSEGTVKADTISSATGSSVAVAVLGVAGAIASADSTADAIGIDAGAGDDSIDSRAKISASSLSNGNTIMNADSKFGVSAAGNSTWDGGAKSAATSSGVVGGEGIDELTSSGDMDVDATAVSTSTAVTFTVGGVSASISTSTANADAYGIDGGEDDDFIENTGSLEVDSDANAVSANIALAGIGVAIASDSVWDGGTTSNSSAFGLRGGIGHDFIRSGIVSDDGGLVTPLVDPVNTVNVKAKSLVSTNSISVTGAGLSVSTTTGTANADSRAIDAGEGDDIVINASDLTSTADAEAYSVSVALTGVGAAIASDAFWDGGTKANADSAGIDGGSGTDQVINLNGVTANAESDTVSASLAYSGILSGAVAASTSTAEADGIRGGTGDDELLSAGTINAAADAQAVGVSVAISGGVAVAGSFLNKTTVADATAKGMAGGVGNDTLSSEETGAITLNADATAVEASIAASGLMAAAAANAGASASTVGFDGGNDDDLIVNAGSLTQNSTADSISGSVAFAPGGLGVVADAKASTDALSQGFAGGAGNDEVRNSGNVSLTSSAETVGLALSATTAGLAISNASADARADAVGFGGDAGHDRIDNSGDLQIVTDSDAKAGALGVSPVGFTVAAADATAATDVTGLSGGDGEDALSNSGLIDIDAVTSADAVAISASALGVSIGSATTTADINVTGFSGGRDNDTLINEESGRIDVLAQADLDSVGVSVTLGGFAEANAATLVLADTTGMAGDSGDDLITNAGNVNIRSQSVSNSTGASVAVFGVAKAKAGGEAQTVATGIDGGDGADTIVNARTGIIRVGPASDPGNDPNNRSDATWMSILRGAAASGTLGGVASAEASAVASTTSTGINGGENDDSISNLGDIQVTANSMNETGAIAIAIFGSSEAAGDSGAKTLAIGLDGDVGNDYIETLGSLTVDAESQLLHNGAAMTFGGAAGASSTLEARTESIGITGGVGEDQILTEGTIVVNAGSGMVSSNSASAAFGSSDVAGVSGATTLVTGIDGGSGKDIIDSSATITLNAFSDLDLIGSSFSLGGSSSSAGQLAATTQAEALLGGDGGDQVVNRGAISITARSEMTSRGKSETGFGSSDANNVSGGVTGAAGMRGGEGDDLLENSVDAEIVVDASTKVNAVAVTYTFAGGSDAGNLLTGLSSADGITGDAGNDRLFNKGSLNVAANSELTARGGSKSTFTGGSSSSAGKSAASAEAVGMNGGEGDDLVVSTGDIEVRAESIARANNNSSSSASFTSDQIAWSVSETNALASGLNGEGGNDTLVNQGNLTVFADSTAYSFAYANGAVISFDGDAESSSTSTATATATGFSAEDGDVVVRNEGQLTVTAKAGTVEDLISTLTYYRLQGDYEEDVAPNETAIAETITEEPDWNDPAVQAKYVDGDILYCTDDACVQDPDVNSNGNHYRVVVTQVDDDNNPDTDPIDEYSWVVFNSVNDLPDLSNSAISSQYADGDIVACKSISCREDPSIESSATYWKVVVRQVDHDNDPDTPPEPVYSWEQQTGLTIEVSVLVTEASFPTYASANANGLDGDGVATASGTTTAIAHGVQLGNGNNHVVSNDMNINAIANSVVNVASDGDVFGDSEGFVTATATAKAYGIVVGDGDDHIANSRTMAVTATPVAQGYSAVSPGGGICIWFFGWWCAAGGTPEAAVSSTFTAEASGILAGNGNNTITNDGDIIVTAAPDVAEDLRRSNDEYAAKTEGDGSPAISVVSNSTAIGIRTGTGHDSVTNNGKITVEAKDILSGCAAGNCSLPTGAQATLSATGIMTDAGNDLVINNGSVSAQIFNNNNPTPAIAITTGGGDDILVLGDESVVKGDIDLGLDNDTLHLIGDPEVQNALTPGSGMNSLVFEGPGYFANSLAGFNDRALKYGLGTYTVPNLPTMQSIEIQEGVIQTGSNYIFASAGLFQTTVNSDGSFGKLHVVGSTDLNGSLTVLRDAEGPYLNETRYGIIEAEQEVRESFVEVTLPSPTQLLAFELNQYPDLVEVEVQAESFTTVATNRLERQLAGYMDGWLSIATGDLKDALGEFQTLSAAEFGEAFQGFSPGQYDSMSLVSADATREFNRTMLQRVHSVRLLGETSSSRGRSVYFASGDKPVLLAFNGSADSIGQLYPAADKKEAEYGLWLESFGQWSNQDQDSGFVGYDSDAFGVAIGLDKIFRDRYLVGLGFGYSNTNIDLDQNQGDGEISSYYGSVYGSFFNEKGYLDGILSYGRQDYDSHRRIVVGSIQQTARSDHDGTSFSAMVEGGLNFDYRPWVLQPFANLQYIYLDEDGFTEEGAGLNQKIESRDTNALVSELGLRISPVVQLETGLLIPEASLAWLYDFDIDDRVVKSSFAGQPGTEFSIDGNDTEQNGAVIGIGITFQGKSGFKPSLKYSGEFRDGYNAHGVTGELRWEF